MAPRFLVFGNHTYKEDATISGGITITVQDKDGGSIVSGVTGPVIIVDAPLSNGTGAPVTGTEGQTLNNVLLGTFSDANPYATAADFTTSINWGDGVTADVGAVALIGGTATSSTFGIYGNHTYTSDSISPFNVAVTVVDDGGSTLPVINTTATISDPLLIVAGGYKVTATEGQASGLQTVATFIDPSGANTPGTYPANIDWGDGTSRPACVNFGGGFFAVQGNHTYAEESAADHAGSTPYTITVTLNHVPGIPQNVTSTATVSDPAVVGTSVDLVGTEGAATGLVPVATFTDPGGPEAVGDYSAAIDWGDGTPVDTGATITFAAGVFTVNGNHTYAEESAAEHPGSDPYAVTVTISHENTTPTVVNSTATIADPAVVATGGNPINGSRARPSARWSSPPSPIQAERRPPAITPRPSTGAMEPRSIPPAPSA